MKGVFLTGVAAPWVPGATSRVWDVARFLATWSPPVKLDLRVSFLDLLAMEQHNGYQ
jgi:hypothetical protein